MNFTKDQLEQIRCLAENTSSISTLQDKINDKFNVHLTYIETRFLIDDLSIQLMQEVVDDKQIEKQDDAVVGFSVTVDPVTRPGAIVNGHVTFSDGQEADWHLDGMGRVGLKPKTSGYKPSAEDLEKFQNEIRDQLENMSNRGSLGL